MLSSVTGATLVRATSMETASWVDLTWVSCSVNGVHAHNDWFGELLIVLIQGRLVEENCSPPDASAFFTWYP